jgi:hypothetical protein
MVNLTSISLTSPKTKLNFVAEREREKIGGGEWIVDSVHHSEETSTEAICRKLLFALGDVKKTKVRTKIKLQRHDIFVLLGSML